MTSVLTADEALIIRFGRELLEAPQVSTAPLPVAGTRVSHSASQATFPWTTRPTDVTIAGNHNGRRRRFDTSQRGALS